MYKPFVSRFKKITNSLKNRHHILKGNFSIWLVFLAIIVVSFFAFQNQAQAITGDYNKDIGNNSLTSSEWNNILADFVDASGDTMDGILNIFMPSGANPELRIQSVSGVDNHWAIYNDRATKDLRFWNNDISGEKNLLNLTNEGRIGINTIAPEYLVDISGDARVTGTLYAGSFVGPLTGTTPAANVSAGNFGSNTGGGHYSFPGNLGIGTTNSGAKLEIYHDSANGNLYEDLTINAGTQSTTIAGSGHIIGFKGSGGSYSGAIGSYANGARGMGVWAGSNTGTPKLYVQGDGNVGIGTISPGAKLDVNVNGMDVGLGLRAGVGMMGGLNIYSGTSPNRRLTAHSYDGFAFYTGAPGFTGGTERIRIDSSGNLGIGTVTPTASLHVQGAGYFSNTVSVATPTSGPHATTKDYVDSAVSGATDSDWTISGNNQYSGVSDNVGIGTTGPQKKLDVRGAAYIEGEFAGSAGSFDTLVLGQGSYSSDSNRELRFQSNTDLGSYHQYMIYNGKAVGEPETFIQGRYQRFSAIGFLGGDTNFLVNTGAGGAGAETSITPTTALTIQYTGNIGINDSTPSYKLDVNGTSRFTQPVIVATPILGPHATTKDYVDSAIGGGSGSTVGYWTMNGTSIYNSNAGNVGIGTIVPQTILEVVKNTNSGSFGTYPAIYVNNPNAAGYAMIGLGNGAGVDNLIGRIVKSPDNSMTVGTYANTKLYFDTNHVTRMTLDTSGNVGIGTTSPGAKLDIAGNLYVGDGGGAGVINFDNTVYGGLQLGGNTYLALANGGNIGIGITGPVYKLDVNGTGRFTNTVVVATPTGGSHATTKDYVDSVISGGISGTTNYIPKFTGANSLGNSLIYDNGTNVGIGTTSPTEKLDVEGRMSLGNNTITEAIIWPNVYDAGANRKVKNVILNTDDMLAYAVDRGWTVTASRGPDSGSLTDMFRPTGSAKWDNVSSGNPVVITINMPNSALDRMIIVPAYRNQLPLDYKVETYDIYTPGNWVTRKDVTGETAPYIKFIDLATQEGIQQIKITVTDAGDGSFDQSLSISNIVATSRYQAGRFTGYAVSAEGDTMYGNLTVNGTGNFSNTVTVATPTASTHATTKSYVDGLLTAGDSDWAGVGGDPTLTGEVYHTGNVGIGTTNPADALHVEGSSLPGIQLFQTGGTNRWVWETNGSVSYIGDSSNGVKNLYLMAGGGAQIRTNGDLIAVNVENTAPANSLVIKATTGNVGINDSTPTYRFDVNGTGRFTNTLTVATPTASTHATTKSYVDGLIGGGVGAGTSGQTLRHDGSSWIANSVLYNNGTNIGVGTASPVAKLDVAGEIQISSTGMICNSTKEGSYRYNEDSDQTQLCNGTKWINVTSCGIMVDSDGNKYGTVQIGGQCWTAENINVGTRLASGGTEPNTSDNIIEKWCYNNSTANCDIYGGLYSWNEVMRGSEVAGAQGICGESWHVPTDNEINILENYTVNYLNSVTSQYVCDMSTTGWQRCADNNGTDSGGTYGAGKSLKEIGQGNGTNDIGFNGILSGLRNTNGSFYALGSGLFLWSSTPSGSSNAWSRYIGTSYSTVFRGAHYRGNGFSVRCLKD